MNARQVGAPADRVDSVLSGRCRVHLRWQSLHVEYAWLPPFQGHAVTQPNRLEVVFSGHSGVALELGRRVNHVDVVPGGPAWTGSRCPTSRPTP